MRLSAWTKLHFTELYKTTPYLAPASTSPFLPSVFHTLENYLQVVFLSSECSGMWAQDTEVLPKALGVWLLLAMTYAAEQ